MNPDIIIVGASYSGAFCASLLAQKGYQVLLIDRLEKPNLGKQFPSIMIDTDTFSKTGLGRSRGDELLYLLDEFYAYSPSAKVKKYIDFSALMVNGHLMLQRILAEGEEAGVQYLQAHIKGPIVENGVMQGVETQEGENYTAALTVDASGMTQALCKDLETSLTGYTLNSKTHGIAYRKMCDTQTPNNELHIHFCFQGGYVWRSPIDIGLGGIARFETDKIKSMVNDFSDQFGWSVGEPYFEALGKIPLRYPLTNMVAPGLAIMGDAAYMINSVRGGGITAGLKGAKALADTLDGPLTAPLAKEELWQYNLNYHRKIGAKLAYQDAMRMILMDETPENMEFALEKDIVTADDIKNSLAGNLLDFSPFQKLQKGLRGAANPGLLLRFNHKLHWAKELHNHFQAYPKSPHEYSDWATRVPEIQAELHS